MNGAEPLEIVSNCDLRVDPCLERTKFESFPYLFKGRDRIWEIVVSSHDGLEFVVVWSVGVQVVGTVAFQGVLIHETRESRVVMVSVLCFPFIQLDGTSCL